MSPMRSAVLALVLASGACDADPTPPTATAPPSASASAQAAPLPPPTASKPVTFHAADKTPLAGDLYLAEDRTAPVVVFAHAFRADRREWEPLATRLAAGRKRFTLLTFDLRGHGGSKASGQGGKKALDWTTMSHKDVPVFVDDVKAAAEHALEATEQKARSVILVGSSLSAAIVSKAAADVPKCAAVALVSPGSAIQRFDVYQPFADVRHLPSFLAASENDNVSREPMRSLEKMAKRGTVKRYPGKAHSARWLAAAQPELWSDLSTWLETVYDEKPPEKPPPMALSPEKK